ncbi:MAG: DUF6351 family protein [Bryobacteraceae bacterium]
MISSRLQTLPAPLAVWALLFGVTGQSFAAQGLEARVLSSRPDMVSGGDALIEIRGAASGSVTATLNGKDITSMFHAAGAPGTWIGRVQGLANARNTLAVKAGRKKARLELVNHPVKGPIFSGPHQKPFVCETEAAGLGPPLDADCSVETKIQYFYKSTQPAPPPEPGRPAASPFKPFHPSAPRPADLAQTTTNEGTTVDYVVRREIGTINRAVYEIAMLHTPGQPLPDPWTPSPAWNGRLVYSFGGGCSAGYRQGRAPSALNDSFLSLGYTSAASSLNVFGNNCDDVISAETLMMVKEHFIEQFGPPVDTIGWGGSGGSMQQHLISQNYPGLLDGILPASSYPDITTVIPSTVDCTLLARAFDSGGQPWTDEQKTAVSGYATWKSCGSWMRFFSPGWLTAGTCPPVVPKTLVYNPATAPTGARCGIYDNEVNVYGRDPSNGFARRTLDNVGVQYGLVAFNAGKISAEQFVTLNERVGGYDRDGNPVAARTTADPVALRLAYQTGRVQSGRGALGAIPILDSRPYLDRTGDIHDSYRSQAIRARLTKANGGAANHVIWTTGPKVPPGAGTGDKLALMDRWLANIRKDTAKDRAALKVVRNKPAELTDTCWTEGGEKIADAGKCAQMYPAFGNPRIAAGAPLADDVLKCSLKPLDAGAYQKPLSAEQLTRLRAVFPQGVCDYSRPGVEQQNAPVLWRKY